MDYSILYFRYAIHFFQWYCSCLILWMILTLVLFSAFTSMLSCLLVNLIWVLSWINFIFSSCICIFVNLFTFSAIFSINLIFLSFLFLIEFIGNSFFICNCILVSLSTFYFSFYTLLSYWEIKPFFSYTIRMTFLSLL